MPLLYPVFDDLVRYETRLYNAINHRLRADHGIGGGTFELLRFIGSRAHTRVNDLAVQFAITVGAASKAVDRSERAGWVARRPNPENRRSSLLSLTPAGRGLLEATESTVEDELRLRLGAPLGPELERLASALTTLRQAIEASGAGLLTPPQD